MSDGIKQMYESQMEREFIAAVDKFKAKDPEEVYVLLKDLQADLQYIAYDDSLTLTRGQWAALNRLQSVMKELMK
jgi:hypothetical protein